MPDLDGETILSGTLHQRLPTSATQGLLVKDFVILKNGQVTSMTPELEPSLLTTIPYQRKDVCALDRFNVHHSPTRKMEHQMDGMEQRRSNLELSQSYKESGIVNFINIQRISWAGHFIRMNEDSTTKNVFNAQPIGTRRRGRPNLR
ncbi:uncharacterized protein TNCV_1267371 [Trichonephila clavipes]|nr:uncharacterized protein TNCV_1267371 [Trichonephila clavipes]